MTRIYGMDEVLGNMDELKEDMRDKIEKALTKGAMVGEGHAKRYCPVDTGTLRRSITTQTHKKNMRNVVVRCGTNIEYAPYQEFGTVRMAAQPFMRPAFFNHKRQIIRAISQELKR